MSVETPTSADARARLPGIEELATREGLSVEFVRRLYAAELERLRAGARIVDFVPVLATTNLKRRLRERRGTLVSAAARRLPATI
jgi:hypothetical protein